MHVVDRGGEARVRRPGRELRRRRRAARASALARVRRRAPRADRRGRERRAAARARPRCRGSCTGSAGVLGAGEPTRGDTVHLDVADRFGNLISATPSGGWLQSSPTIPALGWPLGTRAQMFWLEEGLPSSLAPRQAAAHDAVAGARAARRRAVARVRHARRRPAGAVGAARPRCATSTAGSNLQEAIDAPEWHTDHLIASFYPARGRAALARRRVAVRRRDDRRPAAARPRRHGRPAPWSLGRVSAVAREAASCVAAANARGMQGYAVLSLRHSSCVAPTP